MMVRLNKEVTSTTNENLLRHLMWKYDVTASELAAKAGVTTQTIRNFWKGRVTIENEQNLWTALYCLKHDEIGLANFNSYLEQYYAKRQLDVIEKCNLMIRLTEGNKWS